MSNYEYPMLKVESPNVKYVRDAAGQVHLESQYHYENVRVEREPSTNSIKVGLAPSGARPCRPCPCRRPHSTNPPSRPAPHAHAPAPVP